MKEIEHQQVDTLTYNPGECCLDEVGDLIQNLVRTLQTFEKGKISELGFTISQCYTLFHLRVNKTLTMYELSEKLNVDSSTITRNINKLVRDRYVEKKRLITDQRVFLVNLTQKGEETAKQLYEEVSEIYKKIIQEIPQGEVMNVVNSVNILIAAFKRIKPFCCE